MITTVDVFRPLDVNQFGNKIKFINNKFEFYQFNFIFNFYHRFSELQFRNSLCPPHLRSAYAAQYHDQDFREDEIKVSYLKSGGKLEKTFTVHRSNPNLSINNNEF